MKQFLVLGLVMLRLLGPAAATWCEGGAATARGLAPPAGGGLQAVMTTSELVVGQNRLAFGLLKEHQLLEEADVVVRVYELHGQQARLKVQMQAPYARLEIVEQDKRVHIHPDGIRHVHNEETDVRGVYVTQVTFERPGPWGLEVLAKQGDGPIEVVRLTINVLASPSTPAPGTPAPHSHNLIASDVQDLRQIDTSDPPDPRLHQVRIADAIVQGKPQVIVFATPKFCTSRVCGPVVDIVRTLLPAYGDRVVFTHQEIWQDAAAREFSPTVAEWGLQTEPWIFVVDGKGIIRAKFEGLTTGREIEAALKQILE
ncbi:MAG: hypothetical protein ACRERE_15460 [Candidatus Entotheonellia bacterium]